VLCCVQVKMCRFAYHTRASSIYLSQLSLHRVSQAGAEKKGGCPVSGDASPVAGPLNPLNNERLYSQVGRATVVQPESPCPCECPAAPTVGLACEHAACVCPFIEALACRVDLIKLGSNH
jgi:hypothetical protein